MDFFIWMLKKLVDIKTPKIYTESISNTRPLKKTTKDKKKEKKAILEVTLTPIEKRKKE